MYNVDGANISPRDIVNIASGEGQIPISFLNLIGKHLTFLKDYSTGRNHFNEEREIPVTLSKYVNARWKTNVRHP